MNDDIDISFWLAALWSAVQAFARRNGMDWLADGWLVSIGAVTGAVLALALVVGLRQRLHQLRLKRATAADVSVARAPPPGGIGSAATPKVVPLPSGGRTTAVPGREQPHSIGLGSVATIAPTSKSISKPSVRAAAAIIDREFLPAALEIIQTPASPIARLTALTICAAFATALAWSYFSWIDIHAIAVGKIQPSGKSKVVQPLETGRVIAIRVENGTIVSEGAPLLELDQTETGADRSALEKDLEAATAEASRRRAVIVAAKKAGMPTAEIDFDRRVGPDVRRRETAVYEADLAQLRSTVSSLRAQRSEKLATQQRLNMSIAAREASIKLAKERVEMREELAQNGAGSRAMIIESLQQYEAQRTADVGDRGQLLETQAAIFSLERKLEEAISQFIAEQAQKLAEAEKKRDRAEQDLIKAQSRSDRTILRAPISGVVQQLTVSTVGQVVASGQSLLTLVPQDGPLEVEALIGNGDIGFVSAGQSAVVKVEAFPFTRYGAIDATVLKVSNDAVDQRTASATTDAAATARPQRPNQGPAASDNLVFPATIKLAQRTINVDGKDVPLIPGMTVTVEIKTGSRRAIDYVLSPLREISASTGHER